MDGNRDPVNLSNHVFLSVYFFDFTKDGMIWFVRSYINSELEVDIFRGLHDPYDEISKGDTHKNEFTVLPGNRGTYFIISFIQQQDQEAGNSHRVTCIDSGLGGIYKGKGPCKYFLQPSSLRELSSGIGDNSAVQGTYSV